MRQQLHVLFALGLILSFSLTQAPASERLSEKASNSSGEVDPAISNALESVYGFRELSQGEFYKVIGLETVVFLPSGLVAGLGVAAPGGRYEAEVNVVIDLVSAYTRGSGRPYNAGIQARGRIFVDAAKQWFLEIDGTKYLLSQDKGGAFRHGVSLGAGKRARNGDSAVSAGVTHMRTNPNPEHSYPDQRVLNIPYVKIAMFF